MMVAPRLMTDIQNALGVSPEIAAGIVGNLAHESGGFEQLQELNPLVEGSKGGYGYAQWTGPRRQQFEQFAAAQGLEPSSYEANRDFLLHELTNTPEKRVLASMEGVSDPAQAAEIFSNEFLRPAIPHMEKRQQLASDLYSQAQPQYIRQIQLPDGRSIGLTGKETPEQLNALREKLRAEYETPTQTPTQTVQETTQEEDAEPTLMDKIGSDLSKRATNIGQALGRTESALGFDGQGVPETAWQVATEGALGAGDVLGNLAMAAIERGYPNLPMQMKAPVEVGKSALGALSRIPVDERIQEKGSNVLGRLIEDYQTGAQMNPRLAANVKAAGTTLAMMSPQKPSKVPSFVKETGKNIRKQAQTLIPKAENVTADMLRKEANKAYDLAAKSGGSIKPKAVNSFLDNVSMDVRPQTRAGKLVRGGDEVSEDIMGRLEMLRDNPIDLNEFNEIDQYLSDVIDNHVLPTGKLNAQGRKIKTIQSNLRDTIENASADDIAGGAEGFAALKEARKLWSKQATLRDIEKIVTRSEMMAQPSTGIRSGLRTYLSNPKNTRSLSKQEIEALTKAAKQGAGQEVLNLIASRLPSTIAVGSGSPLVGGALRVGAIPVRNLSEQMTLGRLGDATQLIARGAQPKPTPLESALRALGTSADITGRGVEATGSALGNLERMRAMQLMGLGMLPEQPETRR